MLKCITLFSGGGLVECAMVAKGLEPAIAVERDPHPKRAALSNKIADLHALNFPKTELIRDCVERVEWGILGGLDWFLLHASPSCKSFSLANHEGEELDADIEAAKGTCEAIRRTKPLYFTLENVKKYTNSVSFDLIKETLIDLGYAFTYDILNAQHYGVPQSRERLIVLGHRGGIPISMPRRVRPISWIEALGDRLSKMKRATPTAIQVERLREVRAIYPTTESFLVERVGAHSKCKVRHPYDPSFTLTSSMFTDGKGANRQTFLNIWHNGEWLDLSLRDTAILQTVPEWYDLGKSVLVGGTAIGNGVPCKFYEAILDEVLAHHRTISLTAATAA